MSTALKIIHAPANIGNHQWVLSQYERELGYKSQVVEFYSTWLNYKSDLVLEKGEGNNRQTRINRLKFFSSAILKYNVFNFAFGRSLLTWDDIEVPHWWWWQDIKLLRLLGKKVFMTFHGCDVRMPNLNSRRNEIGTCEIGRCQFTTNCKDVLEPRKKRMLSQVLAYCNGVFYLNPDLGHDVPGGQFLPYANVDVEKVSPVKNDGCQDRPIRILHAPSNPHSKGTEDILSALNYLKNEFDLEILLVEKMKHDEAMEVYRTADLVIDQILAGWYGGFAVEVMAMAKPVACYVRQLDLIYAPKGMVDELPVLRISKDTLVEDLRKILRDRAAWPEIGQASRNFVLKWHNPQNIAKSLVKVYQNPKTRLEF